MSFYNDDPFEDIVRQFFGQSGFSKDKGSESIIEGEEDDRVIDFVESASKVYIVFELPGYIEKDIVVVVEGKNLKINAKKKNEEKMQDYLAQKLHKGVLIRKNLPNFVNPKKYTYTMKNGVLEVVFEKK